MTPGPTIRIDRIALPLRFIAEEARTVENHAPRRPRLLWTTTFTAALAAFGIASRAHALTVEACFAAKLTTGGNLQKCRANEAGKALRGRPNDPAKCAARFQTKLARITEAAVASGVACVYGDNGDGTVLDYDTGLQWEKKEAADGVVDVANPHDVDNRYGWSASGLGLPDGTVFSSFLGRLLCASTDGVTLTGGFAGHCDWRLPTVTELKTILRDPFPCGAPSPCIDPVFGPTAATETCTSNEYNTGSAWIVRFSTGFASNVAKGSPPSTDTAARAVRGGW